MILRAVVKATRRNPKKMKVGRHILHTQVYLPSFLRRSYIHPCLSCAGTYWVPGINLNEKTFFYPEPVEPPPPGEEGKGGASSASKISDAGSPTPGNEPEDSEIMEVEHKRKDLHKTASVFLRTLAPSITKAEVEAVS